MTTVRTLSAHASYACREAGACCTSGWPIDIEDDRLGTIERALASNSARPAPLVRRGDSGHLLLPVVDGGCVFHKPPGPARCSLHATFGHAALPLACRQFPRVVLLDPRGVSVTLSHYCPTAATLLDTDAALSIDAAPAGFPQEGEYVGLDVRNGLPPALRPDMLMDWDAWWHWERRSIELLSDVAVPAEALARLAAAIEIVRHWRPGSGPLIESIDAGFRGCRDAVVHASAVYSIEQAQQHLLAAVPEAMHDDARRALETRRPRVSPHIHRRFLAAHAFGNWTAHLGEGLRTWLRSIETAHVLIDSGLSVREADLLLRHLADPREMAKQWGEVERT